MERDFGRQDYDPNMTMVPFTEFERQQKKAADDCYHHGDYRRVISIVSSMIRLNRALEYDPGCIGLIMHAYHKLEDFENAAMYALKKIELAEGKDAVAHSIAAVAYYYMENYSKAFYHISQTLELEDNAGSHLQANLRIAIYSAVRLKLWKEIIPCAKRYSELDPNHEEILRIGWKAAQKSCQWNDALYFAESLLSIRKSRGRLTAAMQASWHSRDFKRTLKYAECLIELDKELTGSDEALYYAKWSAFHLGDNRKLQRYVLYGAAAEDFNLDPAMPDWNSTVDTHQPPTLHRDDFS